MSDAELSKKIYDCAIWCGFDDCGIIPVDETVAADFDGFLKKRMEDAPESAPFYGGFAGAADVKARFPWAKAVVILVCDYGKFRYPKEMQGRYAKAFFLEPLESSGFAPDMAGFEAALAEYGVRADNGSQFGAGSIGPLRLFAAKAGLGIIRKNNFFYTKNGSYNNLVGYVIDRECELIGSENLTPCSEKCDLCQRACKTKALKAPYTMNPFKCVSFLTTFGNSDVPQGLGPEMLEEWACGCDNCQDACPHNRRHDWTKGDTLPELDELAEVILPENLENVSDEFLIEQVVPRTSGHIQPYQVSALRKNAARSAAYKKAKL